MRISSCKKALLTSLVGVFACTSAALAADPVEFNFMSIYTGPHIFNVETAQPWVEEMKTKSGGTVTPHFFMSGALAKPEEVVTALMNGTLDMAGASVAFDPDLFPLSLHIALPYSYDDAIHSTAIINYLYENNAEIKAEFDNVGKVLALWQSDRSALFSAKGKISSPADLKGKRVLFWNGSQVDQIKAWGGIPVQVSPNDTYVALQRGMGEVFLGPLPVGVAYKLMEVAKEITVLPAFVTSIIVWMNKDLWNSMSPDQQKLIEESVNTWGKKTGEDLVRGSNKDMETMKAAGCKIYILTAEEYKPFRDADAPVILGFVEKEFKRMGVQKDPKEWVDYIYSVSDQLRAK